MAQSGSKAHCPLSWSCLVGWCRRSKGLSGILRVRRTLHQLSYNRSCWNISKKVTLFSSTKKCGAFFFPASGMAPGTKSICKTVFSHLGLREKLCLSEVETEKLT